jgi:hypothetical protein
MQLEKQHLKIACDKFNSVKMNKCNVLDEIFQYLNPGLDNLLNKYIISLFDSYDYIKEKYPQHPELIRENWESFYKLLQDNIGKTEEELNVILKNRYGSAY